MQNCGEFRYKGKTEPHKRVMFNEGLCPVCCALRCYKNVLAREEKWQEMLSGAGLIAQKKFHEFIDEDAKKMVYAR